MSTPPVDPSRASDMVNNLVVVDGTSRVDILLARLCAVSGIIAFSFNGADYIFTIPNQFVRIALVVLAATSAIVFIFTLCILGIKTAGSINGRKTFFGQLWFTLSRVTLYLFLPSLLVTLAIILIAYLTGYYHPQPTY